MSDDMVKYYRDRAREYEEIYEWRDPYRQEEQELMEKEIKEAFRGRSVLDIGCGTGYWTERLSKTAKNIVGIDINDTVLDVARSKSYFCPTEFRIMDAHNMSFPSASFTGVLATFWLSHVRWNDIPDWLEHMHDQINLGSRVLIADNNFLEGIGGELVRKKGDHNTYKLRTLNDGSQHLIVKNYFTKNEIFELFGNYCKELSFENIFFGRCFWWVNYVYR
jgi:SAM-dependent methyltransferase